MEIAYTRIVNPATSTSTAASTITPVRYTLAVNLEEIAKCIGICSRTGQTKKFSIFARASYALRIFCITSGRRRTEGRKQAGCHKIKRLVHDRVS